MLKKSAAYALKAQHDQGTFCAKKGLENCEILVIVSAELLKRLNERIAVI